MTKAQAIFEKLSKCKSKSKKKSIVKIAGMGTLLGTFGLSMLPLPRNTATSTGMKMKKLVNLPKKVL